MEYLTIACVVFICFLPTVKTSFQTIKIQTHGRVVSEYLSSFYFPDWKGSLMKIKPRLEKNDVLMTTIPPYVDFYLGRNSYQFRQRRYDSSQHTYINLPVDTLHSNANSTQAVQKLLDNADKAWLIADYYFDNVMTDPKTKAYIINKMRFEYDMSNEYISVFSYDKAKPNIRENNLFEHIHREYRETSEYQFESPLSNFEILLIIDAEGITLDNEMVVLFNGSYSLGVLRQNGELFQQNGDSRSRQVYTVLVPNTVLRPGTNAFQVGLNSLKAYRKCRFVIHNIDMQFLTSN